MRNLTKIFLLLLLFFASTINSTLNAQAFEASEYKSVSRTIIDSALAEKTGFDRLMYFADYFPTRL